MYNLLFIGDFVQSKIIEKLYFVKEKIGFKKLFYFDEKNCQIQESSYNSNKNIAKRLSLVEKAKKINCFGLLICNPSS